MFITLDIGGTNIRVVVFKSQFAGRMPLNRDIVYSASIATSQNVETVLAEIGEGLSAASLNSFEQGSVAIAGVVDMTTGILQKSVHLQSWQGVNLKKRFQEILNCEVSIVNDTFAAVLGYIGVNRPTTDFWYVNWGTGIGGALAIKTSCDKGGKFRLQPSEFGHSIINFDSQVKCYCGQVGCWDSLCSGAALVEKYQKNLEKLSIKEWKDTFIVMSKGLVNLAVSYTVPKILLNGGVIQHQIEKLSLLEENFENSLKIFEKKPEIELVKEADLLGIYGAWVISSNKATEFIESC